MKYLIIYFNSIKVQLRQQVYPAWASFMSFQFHKGTIKTPCRSMSIKIVSYFNSIKVQLRQGYLLKTKLPKHISIP